MGKVKIKYRPFPFCPIRFTSETTLATDWDHITPEHFTPIAELIIRGSISDPVRALSQIFHVPESIITRLHPFHQYTLIDQIGKPLDGTLQPRNYLPTLQINKQKLIGPSDRLSNISFGEFIYADSYFMAYGINGDKSLLNKHIAVLFRPDKQTFNSSDLDKHSTLIAQLPDETRIAWQYNYIILRQHLESRYTHVFPKVEEELEKEPDPKPATNEVYQQWITVYDRFVGDDIINSERYFNKNAHEVLHYLDIKIRDSYKNQSPERA